MNCHGGGQKNKGSHGNKSHKDDRHNEQNHFAHGHSHASHWWWISIGIGLVILYSFFK